MPGHSLHAVLEAELEGVLQGLFAARQDVLEALGDPSDDRVLRSAEVTLQGCVATLQLMLGLLRSVPGPRQEWSVPLDRMSAAFCILRPSGEVLYMNAAATELIGRDQRAVLATAFAERTWSDRPQMRTHLDRADRYGVDQDTFAVVRGDGRTVELTLRTQRIKSDGDAFLLMCHVRPGDERVVSPPPPSAPGPRGAGPP